MNPANKKRLQNPSSAMLIRTGQLIKMQTFPIEEQVYLAIKEIFGQNKIPSFSNYQVVIDDIVNHLPSSVRNGNESTYFISLLGAFLFGTRFWEHIPIFKEVLVDENQDGIIDYKLSEIFNSFHSFFYVGSSTLNFGDYLRQTYLKKSQVERDEMGYFLQMDVNDLDTIVKI